MRQHGDSIAVHVLPLFQPIDDFDNVFGVLSQAGMFGTSSALPDSTLVETHNQVASFSQASRKLAEYRDAIQRLIAILPAGSAHKNHCRSFARDFVRLCDRCR